MSVLICPGCRTVYREAIEVCPKDNLPLIVRSRSSLVLEQGRTGEGAPLVTETALSAGLMVGEYRIEGPISENDMGTTYAAIHPLIRKRVAIRVLHQRYAEDHRAVSRFVMEARAVNEIGHHNIVDVLSIGELWDGRNYLVMELLDGLGLHDILRRQKRLRPGELLPLFEQICDALDAAHAAHFIHRDLKPENIVVLRRPPRPFVKIQDFGMAKLKGQGESETDVATLVGTPTYMAPEHSRGDGIDARADIYSLGVILYEMLTGKPPYPAQALLSAFSGKAAPKTHPPSALSPSAVALDQVVLTAMAWDREERFPSVLALWDGFRRAVSEPLPWTISLDPLQPSEPGTSPARNVALLTRPPLARPPEPEPLKSALAPEAIVGEVGEDELVTRQADRKMMHFRPQPIPVDGEAGLDETPTDIFCGTAELPPRPEDGGSGFAPARSLGEPACDELGDDDTEISSTPLSMTDIVERRPVSARTLVGVGPPRPVDDDTHRQAALVATAEPVELLEATVKPVAPEEVAPPAAEASAEELPDNLEEQTAAPASQYSEDEDYCSFEIITEPPDGTPD